MTDRVALITDSTRGMGKAEAYEFAKRGYNVILNYVHSAEKTREIQEDITTSFGVKVAAVQADLSRE